MIPSPPPSISSVIPFPPPSISSVIPSQVGCQVVAVLLHYFFLVTFMWMLMEGVVLYVALVRVFVEHKTRYIIVYTAISYGELSVFQTFHPKILSCSFREKFLKTKSSLGRRLVLCC